MDCLIHLYLSTFEQPLLIIIILVSTLLRTCTVFITSRVINLLVFFAVHICRSSRSCFPWNMLQNSTKRFLWRIHPWIWYSRNAGQCTIDTWAGDIICILQSTIITCRHSSVSTSLRRLSGCSPFTHSMNNAFCVCKWNTTCSHSNETTSAVLYKLLSLKKLSWSVMAQIKYR